MATALMVTIAEQTRRLQGTSSCDSTQVFEALEPRRRLAFAISSGLLILPFAVASIRIRCDNVWQMPITDHKGSLAVQCT